MRVRAHATLVLLLKISCDRCGNLRLHDGLQRCRDPLHLRGRRHAVEQPAEVHVLYTGYDVLPAIGGEHGRLDLLRFHLREGTTGGAEEILRVRFRLRSQNAVHGADQCRKLYCGRYDQ